MKINSNNSFNFCDYYLLYYFNILGAFFIKWFCHLLDVGFTMYM